MWAIGGAIVVGLLVRYARHDPRNSPEYAFHESIMILLGRSSFEACYQTCVQLQAMDGVRGMQPNHRSLASAYSRYFSTVLILEKHLDLCQSFLSGAVYKKLLARVGVIKSTFAFEKRAPQFDLFNQIKLGLLLQHQDIDLCNPIELFLHIQRPANLTGEEGLVLFEALVESGRASTYAKLQELEKHFLEIHDLIDPEEMDVSAGKEEKFRRRSRSLCSRAVALLIAGLLGTYVLFSA